MKQFWSTYALGMCVLALLNLTSCSRTAKPDNFSWIEGSVRPTVKSSTLSVRWTYPLVADFSSDYIPVENAVAAIDLDRGRLYTGSSTGILWALSLDAKPIYRKALESPIEASPALDRITNQLYLGTVSGELLAFNARDGSLKWRIKSSGPIRQKPLLSKDAIYIKTENDVVVAYERSTGELLWRYRREERQGFLIAGSAGILRSENRMITGFSDGGIVALDIGDGHVLWERDTSLDIEENGAEALRFLDVDTTPVQVDDRLYVASFSGGLYALSVSTGAIEHRSPEIKGIVGIATNNHLLILSSAQEGIICINSDTHKILWRYEIERGAPGIPRIIGRNVYVGESGGAFLALSLRTGREISRIEYGHGFSAPAAMEQGRGYIISNGGTLLAFNY